MTPERFAVVKEVFLEASELPPAERASLLARRCGDDAELREEVESLLKHHDPRTILPPVDDETFQDLAKGSRLQSAAATEEAWPRGASRTVRRLGPWGHLAMGILAACLALSLVGWFVREALQKSVHASRAAVLDRVLAANAKSLETWIAHEKAEVRIVARDPSLRRTVEQLVAVADHSTDMVEELKASPAQTAIRDEIKETLGEHARFAVWNRDFVTIADWSEDGAGLGLGVTPYGAGLLTRVFDGETVMQLPGIRDPITKGYPVDRSRPHIGLLTPLHDQDERIVAALLVYEVGMFSRFNEILSILRFGETGDTYAFDASGLMLSESRFNDQLRRLELIPNDSNSHSSLTVRLHDPGGDLTSGFRPSTPREACPLTEMARFATAGRDGINLAGYRDYRGALVVGAWRWLPEHQFGIVTEIEVREIDRSLRYIKAESWVIFGLLAAAVFGIVASWHSLRRLRRQLGRTQRLGQYTLEEKIGEGGMGVVYRARHALLKRPTAIKLLKPEIANRRTIAWFEREVQLASRLTHPNTIEIFDFGITPESIFYYVMEYLEGVTLEELVTATGPVNPGRVIYILKQVCESLNEAHLAGLIHRDIKPHNIMLCQRGGRVDVVKVLDFGLVKEVGSEHTTVIAGTPSYMAPERIRDPKSTDARTDIYSVGAVAFKLLTGCEVDGTTRKASDPSRGSSEFASEPDGIPPEFFALIHSTLADDPNDRPRDMRDLLAQLERLEPRFPWSQCDARRWWDSRQPGVGGAF